MADTRYVVEIAFQTSGSLAGHVDAANGKISNMKANLGGIRDIAADVGGSLVNAFQGAVERAADLTMAMGKLAGAAAIGAATYGVVKLNNELEKTTISLGTIFAANGLSGSMTAGMRDASSIMGKIRQDAKALPGETEDLLGIFKAISIPGARAGADINRLEKLSADIMAAGAVAGLNQEMVAREAGQLLSGRAGAHNILGSTLFGLSGDLAEQFNKYDPSKRLEVLEQGMKKYGAATEYFNSTFDAQWSTLLDNAKNFLRIATAPLFENVKGTLAKINDWFTEQPGTLSIWEGKISSALTKAWQTGVDMIQEWGPAIAKFLSDAEGDMESLWGKYGPTIKEVANALREALGNGSALDKIESALKLYMAMRVASPVAGMAGKLYGASGGLGGLGMGGGGGAVAELGAAGPAGWAALLALLGSLPFLVGAFSALTDSTSEYHARASDAFARITADMDRLHTSIDVNVMPTLERMGTFGLERIADNFDEVNHVIEMAHDPLYALAYYTEQASKQTGEFGIALETASGWLKEHSHLLADRVAKDYERAGVEAASAESEQSIRESRGWAVGRAGGGTFLGQALKEAGFTPDAARNKGGGGTNIAKVEIVVNTNQDPGRVAELVLDHVKNIQRHPRVARGVPNYSR